MTLQSDLETAVADVQADSQKLKDIVNGPASGAASMVTVDSGDVKTVARAIAEVGDTSNQATKDLLNVTDADFLSKASSAGAAGVKVSGDDTTAGDLEAKLLTDTSLNATTQNGGANETRTLAVRAKSGGGIIIDADGVSVDPSFAKDQEARDLALTAYIKADIQASDPAGVYGDIISDNFVADTLATKTNAIYDAAGDFYHNAGGYAGLGGNVATAGMSISGGDDTASGESQAQAYDGDTNTLWRSIQSGAAANEAAYLGQDFGAGNEKNIRQAYFNQGFSGISSHGATDVGLDYSDDGTNWTRAASASGLTQTQSWATIDSSYTGYHRYWRIVVISGLPATWRVQELQLKEGTYNPTTNMTLQPSATTLPTANPLDLSMYFRVQDIDAVTDGTDRVIKASIDGGTTWATATITSLGAYGSTDKLIRADADVSAQTGDQFVWELATANAKEQQVKQVASLAGY